jgi:hypothetical protein
LIKKVSNDFDPSFDAKLRRRERRAPFIHVLVTPVNISLLFLLLLRIFPLMPKNIQLFPDDPA